MPDAVVAARWQFAFTIMFHYLFPVLTMGLGVLIAVLKTIELRTGKRHFGTTARFWARIFAITFATGVVTGIPMEFQFGTNWARFSHFAGPVVGQTLFMDGVFAFFAESSFHGVFLFGEKRISRGLHWLSSVMVALGAVVSGYFIVATNAWVQHPVAYRIVDGRAELTSLWGLPEQSVRPMAVSTRDLRIHGRRVHGDGRHRVSCGAGDCSRRAMTPTRTNGRPAASCWFVIIYLVNIYRVWRGKVAEVYH